MAMLGLSDNNTVSCLSFISPKAGPFDFVGSLKTSEGKFIMVVKQRRHLKVGCERKCALAVQKAMPWESDTTR